MILGVLGIVALFEVVLIMTMSAIFAASIVGRLASVIDPAPAPTATGCPFGPDDCGG